MIKYMVVKENKVLVQIGTYNGCNKDDPFDKIVKSTSPSKVILVEPNKSLNDTIWNNYKGINNIFLENVAITREANRGLVKLVYPKNKVNGASVNGISYGEHNFSLLPMDDWGSDFEVLEAPSMTLNELCKKYRIKHIHYLQIDTEGYDAEIIKSIDFNRINIDIIKYEDWPFGENCFKGYGDKSKLYGKNGMRFVKSLLESLGYILTAEGKHDIVAVKMI